MLLFSGTSNPELAQQIASFLGISLSELLLERFPDGEISLRLKDSVRGKHAFVVQSLALDTNNYLMELLIIMDALKRASAKEVIPVISYYGYCRQDRKDKPREPITAKLVANMLVSAGATHVLTMDLHAGQLEGFFDIPVDHIHALPIIAKMVKESIKDNLVVVAPDVGSVKLAHKYASALNADFAIVDKHRLSSREVEAVSLIGDVKGKNVLLADDMCSTGSTLVSAAKACQEKGAKRILACVTHGIFIEDAVELIESSPIEALWMSNTIPYTDRLAKASKIKILPVGDLFGQAIRCITSQESIASLYP